MAQIIITYDIESKPVIRNEITLDETDGRLWSDENLFRWLRGKEHIDPRTPIRVISRQELPAITRASDPNLFSASSTRHDPFRGSHAHAHDHGDGVRDAMHHHDHTHFGDNHHGHHDAPFMGEASGDGSGRATSPDLTRMSPAEIAKLSLSEQARLLLNMPVVPKETR